MKTNKTSVRQITCWLHLRSKPLTEICCTDWAWYTLLGTVAVATASSQVLLITMTQILVIKCRLSYLPAASHGWSIPKLWRSHATTFCRLKLRWTFFPTLIELVDYTYLDWAHQGGLPRQSRISSPQLTLLGSLSITVESDAAPPPSSTMMTWRAYSSSSSSDSSHEWMESCDRRHMHAGCGPRLFLTNLIQLRLWGPHQSVTRFFFWFAPSVQCWLMTHENVSFDDTHGHVSRSASDLTSVLYVACVHSHNYMLSIACNSDLTKFIVFISTM